MTCLKWSEYAKNLQVTLIILAYTIWLHIINLFSNLSNANKIEYISYLLHDTVENIMIFSALCKVAWFMQLHDCHGLKSRNHTSGWFNNNIFYRARTNIFHTTTLWSIYLLLPMHMCLVYRKYDKCCSNSPKTIRNGQNRVAHMILS